MSVTHNGSILQGKNGTYILQFGKQGYIRTDPSQWANESPHYELTHSLAVEILPATNAETKQKVAIFRLPSDLTNRLYKITEFPYISGEPRSYIKIPVDDDTIPTQEEFTELIQELDDYIIKLHELSAYYPDCKNPWMPCIHDIILGKHGDIFIITDWVHGKSIGEMSPDEKQVFLPDALQALIFFEENKFTFKYFGDESLFVNENKQLQFSISHMLQHSTDPFWRFSYHNPGPKSDIFTLGYAFLMTRKNSYHLHRTFPFDPTAPIEHILWIQEDLRKFVQKQGWNERYVNLLCRMLVFFPECRPTAKQALDYLDGKEFKNLPTQERIIDFIYKFNDFLKENGYPYIEKKQRYSSLPQIKQSEEITISIGDLLSLDYTEIMRQAEEKHDQKCLDALQSLVFSREVIERYDLIRSEDTGLNDDIAQLVLEYTKESIDPIAIMRPINR